MYCIKKLRGCSPIFSLNRDKYSSTLRVAGTAEIPLDEDYQQGEGIRSHATRNVGLRLLVFELENEKVGVGTALSKYLKHYQGKGKFDLLSVVTRIELVTLVYQEYSSLYYKPYISNLSHRK